MTLMIRHARQHERGEGLIERLFSATRAALQWLEERSLQASFTRCTSGLPVQRAVEPKVCTAHDHHILWLPQLEQAGLLIAEKWGQFARTDLRNDAERSR